jgi:hypothetical protein
MPSDKLNDPERLVVQKIQGQLTNQEYVDQKGVVCPYCRDRHVLNGDYEEDEEDGVELNVNCEYGYRKIICSTCGKRWKDIYRLVGYIEEDESVGQLTPWEG